MCNTLGAELRTLFREKILHCYRRIHEKGSGDVESAVYVQRDG